VRRLKNFAKRGTHSWKMERSRSLRAAHAWIRVKNVRVVPLMHGAERSIKVPKPSMRGKRTMRVEIKQ